MWTSQTLKDLFSKQFADAEDLVADLTAKLADPQLAEIESAINTLLTDAQALKDSAQQALDDLNGSGIFAIAIAPAVGGWLTRLQTAPNAPPLGGTVYSAAMLSIFIAPTTDPVADAYLKMKESLLMPMEVDDPTLPALSKPALVPETTPEWMEEGAWKSQTVGDLFPGALAAANLLLNAAQKKLTLAQNAKTKFDAQKALWVDSLASAGLVVTAMSNTGLYSVLVPPGPGDWLTRLGAESGAPVNDNSYFSAGTASVVQAADLSVVTANWNKLIGALA